MKLKATEEIEGEGRKATMLSRAPTRIEMKVEDIAEYEVRQEQMKSAKGQGQGQGQGQGKDSTMSDGTGTRDVSASTTSAAASTASRIGMRTSGGSGTALDFSED